jgi:hypothetical protein
MLVCPYWSSYTKSPIYMMLASLIWLTKILLFLLEISSDWRMLPLDI